MNRFQISLQIHTDNDQIKSYSIQEKFDTLEDAEAIAYLLEEGRDGRINRVLIYQHSEHSTTLVWDSWGEF